MQWLYCYEFQVVIYCALEEAFDKIHTPLTLNHSLQDTFTHSFFCFKPFEASFSTHIYKYTDAFNVILLFTPSVYYYHLKLTSKHFNLYLCLLSLDFKLLSADSSCSSCMFVSSLQASCVPAHVCLHMLCRCVCGLFCRCIKY